jgi:hypothetical protein
VRPSASRSAAEKAAPRLRAASARIAGSRGGSGFRSFMSRFPSFKLRTQRAGLCAWVQSATTEGDESSVAGTEFLGPRLIGPEARTALRFTEQAECWPGLGQDAGQGRVVTKASAIAGDRGTAQAQVADAHWTTEPMPRASAACTYRTSCGNGTRNENGPDSGPYYADLPRCPRLRPSGIPGWSVVPAGSPVLVTED